MKYAVQIGSGDMIYISSFIKIGLGIEMFIVWDTDSMEII
jgi:hypothetical protein